MGVQGWMRLGALGAVAIAGAHSAGVGAQSAAERHAEVVERYCVTCHNPRVLAGELVLDPASLAEPSRSPDVWEQVIRKLRAGAMPPAGMPRPDAAAQAALIDHLTVGLDRAAQTSPPPGRPALQRLSRTEYANAVRDLLAIEIDPAAWLPPDDPAGGFDNNADVLRLSPVLLERYLAAAARISALAVGNPWVGATSQIYRAPGDASQTHHLEGLPLGTRGGLLARHYFPLDGEYTIGVKLLDTNMGAIRGLEEPHDLEITIDGERVFLARVGGEEDFRVSAANATDMVMALDERLRVRLPVQAGSRQVGVAFLQRTAAQGGTRLQAFERSTIDAMHHGGLPHVASVTVSGPFEATGSGDTSSRRRIFECRPAAGADDTVCASRIIASLARRAFRRPVTGEERDRLLDLYRAGRDDEGFERGIEHAVRGILANPKFLLRTPPEEAAGSPGPVRAIGDLELASALSFFLWSSIPDDELLDLGMAGTLGQPGVLEAQVRRMLADRRAGALVTNFAAQWLQLRNLRSAAPDKNLFPDFDDNLRRSFLRETELFVTSVIREDRSVLDLLAADYTFLDERLARHYGIQGIKGSHFRRVTLADDRRHGLLGQGSILLLTSHSDRTSPVVRGKWVLENLLGLSLPPPPPDVPSLEEADAGGAATVRASLEAHRRHPGCATCHSVMDPIGLALEPFDAVGAWRDEDNGVRVDASGALMDGTVVDGPGSLRAALLARPDVLAHTMAEKLLTYAIGRQLEPGDMPAVRTIVRAAAAQDYRVSALVLGVVTSQPFRTRMTPPPGGG